MCLFLHINDSLINKIFRNFKKKKNIYIVNLLYKNIFFSFKIDFKMFPFWCVISFEKLIFPCYYVFHKYQNLFLKRWRFYKVQRKLFSTLSYLTYIQVLIVFFDGLSNVNGVVIYRARWTLQSFNETFLQYV